GVCTTPLIPAAGGPGSRPALSSSLEPHCLFWGHVDGSAERPARSLEVGAVFGRERTSELGFLRQLSSSGGGSRQASAGKRAWCRLGSARTGPWRRRTR